MFKSNKSSRGSGSVPVIVLCMLYIKAQARFGLPGTTTPVSTHTDTASCTIFVSLQEPCVIYLSVCSLRCL